MQFAGLVILVAGYAAVYKAAQMLKRPAGGTSGSYLYWLTGVPRLGAPTGGTSSSLRGLKGAGSPLPSVKGGGGNQTGASGGVGLAK